MATLDQTDPVVLAIRQATHKRLQLLLLDMYHQVPTTAKYLSDELTIDANKVGIPPNLQIEKTLNTDSGHRSSLQGSSVSGKVKGASAPTRKRCRYAICDQCEQEFDVSINKDGDCQWHKGMLHRS
jgi:hypothetical protein